LEGETVKERRWKLIALLAAGIAIGIVIVGTPAGAHVASWTHNWNTHIKPRADARYVKKSAVRTIQGNYAVGLVAANTNDDGWDSISFGFQLASPPEEHFIQSGTAPPAQCPGTVANPRAAPGHLCVYEETSLNRSAVTLFTGTTGTTNQASRWGAGVWLQPAAAGNSFSYGTWAVTAPAGTSPARVAPGASSGQVAGE
jgi:hypothetical protein